MTLDYGSAKAVSLVIQTGSFEKAARLLSVTPSAVSQRVKAFEERLGTALIERGTPCIATEHGSRLCRHMEHVGLLEHELFAQLPEISSESRERVTIDVAVNSDSLATWFMPAMTTFAKQSGFLLGIAVDDEDHTAGWLQRGHVVAAVTSSSAPVAGSRVRLLGKLRYKATASPDFHRRHFSNGVGAASLVEAPTITFNQKDRLQQDWADRIAERAINVPTHRLPSSTGFVEANLGGLGWCLNPSILVDAHIATGRLVELIPGDFVEVALFWQVSRLAAERLASLTTAVAKEAAARLAN